MKTAILILLCGTISSKSIFGQLTITPGGQLYMSGNSQLTLHNTNLVNNGSITASNSSVSFTGNLNSTISGTQPVQFYEMVINKTSNSSVLLQRAIGITQRIIFTSGYLDLNNRNIDLAPLALLEGEIETSRIIGSAGGKVIITKTLNTPIAENPGNLGAIFTSSQNMGSVTIGRGHQSQVNGFGNGNSILRYYDISPANNSGLNATLRFSYFNGELNSLNESTLVLWRSIDNLNWTNEGFTSRSAAANYVEKAGINSFSRWTLSSPNNALPVLFSLFNVKCEGNAVVITWKTVQELNGSHFTIERSEDGTRWIGIGNVPAAGNSSTEKSYSFRDHQPLQQGFYRIAQYDMDGRVQYTNIIHSGCDIRDLFTVWPNPASKTIFINIVTVTPSQAIIKLFDSKGALAKTHRTNILQGSNQVVIDISRFSPGVYQLVAEWNQEQIRKSTTIIKQ